MTQLKTIFATAALAAGLSMGLAACNNPESAPEPENEQAAEMMPATPDAGAAQDAAAAGQTSVEGAPEEPGPAPAG